MAELIPENLVVPVYLDTQLLFDLLASIEDGFSVVENVTQSFSIDEEDVRRKGGAFGLANLMGIFKLDVERTSGKTSEIASGSEVNHSRYHTAGSLFNKFRNTMLEHDVVKQVNTIEEFDSLNAGDFVELSCRFTPNPVHSSFLSLSRLVDIYVASVDPHVSTGKSGGKRLSPEVKEAERIKEIVDVIVSDVDRKGIRDYVLDFGKLGDRKLVATLYVDYLRDISETVIPFGRFKILAKVADKTSKGDSISLIRGSAFEGLSEDLLKDLFDSLSDTGDFTLPELVLEIPGPSLRALPIAVFA